MDSIVTSGTSSGTVQLYQEKLFKEDENENLLNSGRRWLGKDLTGTDLTETYYSSMPGIVSNSQITYRFNFVRRSSTPDVLNIYESGILLQQLTVDETAMGDGETGEYANDVPVTVTGGVPQANPNSSVVKITMAPNNQEAQTWLDWMEIYYQRTFVAQNDALVFTTPDTTGTVQYSVSNLSSEARAFDVTNHSAVRKISLVQTGSSCTFQIRQTGGAVRVIAVVGKNGYKTPPSATKVDKYTPNNLHDFQDQVDLIIIAPAEFIAQANRLKNLHQSNDSLNTLVVDIQQVFNEFAGGLPDPLAIREFLQYTQTNWADPKPHYVLLLGNGHYDYKNISTSQKNYIPPWETDYSFETVISYPSDDMFIMLGPDNTYSLALGRIPARNLQDATTSVDKIISYETTAPLDTWRNRITIVSDDGKTSEGDDGSRYTDHSEELAGLDALKNFDQNKIYIVQYPTVNSAGGRRKPDANVAIVDAINSGAVITNYIGHGNERLWAHEAIFTREDNLPQLNNTERLTFVATATAVLDGMTTRMK